MNAAATFAVAAAIALPTADQPPAQRPSFPAGVEWVTVDAVVLDDAGLPVRGLTVDDFMVKDEGVPQTITAFEAIEAPSVSPRQAAEPAASVASPFEPVPPFASPVSAAPRPGRAFVVVFDDLHLEHADTPRARAAVRAFVDSLADGDRLTLVTPGGGLWWKACIPEGRAALAALLLRLDARPRTGESRQKWMSDDEAIRIRDGDPTVQGYVERRWEQVDTTIKDPDVGESVRAAAERVSFDVQRRTRTTLDVLVRALASLSGVRGRKSVMLVSGGFVRDPTIPEFARVLAESQRANAAIYFVDARGLAAVGPHLSAESGAALQLRRAPQDATLALGALDRQAEATEGLAADSGGFSIRKTNDLGAAMTAVARESTAYYLVGYAAPGADGKKARFRRIDVQVSRPGVRVRARRGYYPSGGMKPSAADELDRAVDSPFDQDGIPLRVATFVLDEKSRGKLRVLITTDVDLRALASEQGAALDYGVAISSDTSAQRRSREPLRLPAPGSDGWRSVTRQALLAPGAYQARIVVRHAKTGRIGSLVQDFAVPQARGLRVSTPVLSDRLRAATGSGPAMTARRTFARAGVLHGQFDVYGAARAKQRPPSVKAGFIVRHADGTVVAVAGFTPLVQARDGTLRRNFGVPLDAAQPGPYELVIVAEDETNGRRVEARGSFFVEGPH
jgi:VWFA-related protein